MNNIFRLKILSTDYKSYENKTTCSIKYINPISNKVCLSKGIAKCNPKDKNRLIIGQRIAESRAKHNMYTHYSNELFEASKNAVYKHNVLAKRELSHLQEIINSL